MIICGLDIATKTGCAIIGRDQGLLHGEAHRPRGTTDAEIFRGFRLWLRPLLVSWGVGQVGIEEPLRSDLTRTNDDGDKEPISQMKTFLRLYGLFGHAVELCEAMNIPFFVINQSTWRKEFTGNGRATKDDSVAKCAELGWQVKSRDVAEACGVAWVTRSWLFPEKAAKPGDMFHEKHEAAA